MNSNTPYAPPKSTVTDAARKYAELKIFSAQGRIGRVRFVGWSIGFMMLARIVLVIVAGGSAAIGSQALTMTLFFIGVIGMYMVISLFAIQRLHDLDKSGWLSLLILIPLINVVLVLFLFFAPGSEEANQYGAPPPPNSTGVLVLAWLMPAIMIIGILAAIAIPAYQSYVQKDRQAGTQSQPLEQQQ
jgi:uncharacterized membrane protein YhaH (DUF805 family)